jgi:hypothetical protein
MSNFKTVGWSVGQSVVQSVGPSVEFSQSVGQSVGRSVGQSGGGHLVSRRSFFRMEFVRLVFSLDRRMEVHAIEITKSRSYLHVNIP